MVASLLLILSIGLTVISDHLYSFILHFFLNEKEWFLVLSGFSVMLLMSIMICVHYANKRERLSSSLPGMIDVNKELVEKALEGDAISQYFIGRKYELEDGAIQNEHTAFAWYALSAEGGCAEAKAKFDD